MADKDGYYSFGSPIQRDYSFWNVPSTTSPSSIAASVNDAFNTANANSSTVAPIYLTSPSAQQAMGWGINGTNPDYMSRYLNAYERNIDLGEKLYDTMNSPWTKALPWAGFGLQAAGTLANAFLGWNNMNTAKNALNFQMDMARKNFNNNVTMLEDARQARKNEASAFSGRPVKPYQELDRI